MFQRITEKYLNQLTAEYNQKYDLKSNQKGFLKICPSNGYYQLHQILKNNSTAVNQLTSGTPKEIYDYILYKLESPKISIDELKQKVKNGTYTYDDFLNMDHTDLVDLVWKSQALNEIEYYLEKEGK